MDLKNGHHTWVRYYAKPRVKTCKDAQSSSYTGASCPLDSCSPLACSADAAFALLAAAAFIFHLMSATGSSTDGSRSTSTPSSFSMSRYSTNFSSVLVCKRSISCSHSAVALYRSLTNSLYSSSLLPEASSDGSSWLCSWLSCECAAPTARLSMLKSAHLRMRSGEKADYESSTASNSTSSFIAGTIMKTFGSVSPLTSSRKLRS